MRRRYEARICSAKGGCCWRPTTIRQFAVLAVLLLPWPGWGAGKDVPSFWAQSRNVGAAEVVEGDHFACGPLVIVSGTVTGDLYACGGQVIIDGQINGDLLAAGGRVTISGEVGQDARVAGGQISVSGRIGRNLTVGAGNLDVARSAAVGGNVVLAGGNVHVAAPVAGSAKIAAGSLIFSNRLGGNLTAAVGSMRVTSNAEIVGQLTYYSDKEVEVEPGANVGKMVRHKPPFPRPSPERVFIIFTGAGLLWLLISFSSTLILGLLSVRYLPGYHQTVADNLTAKPWQSLGVGFVVAVVTPVVFALLFAFVVTIPIAIILAAAYGIHLFWGRIFVISALGARITGSRRGWGFLLGLVIYYVIAIIPVVGWLFVLLIVLAGLGAEMMARKQFFVDARAKGLL